MDKAAAHIFIIIDCAYSGIDMWLLKWELKEKGFNFSEAEIRKHLKYLIKVRMIGAFPIYKKRYNGTYEFYKFKYCPYHYKGKELIFELPKMRGLYFLFQKSELRYIGMTTNFEKRIKDHRRGEKRFDDYLFFNIHGHSNDLKRIEGDLIQKYIPTYNKCHIAKKEKIRRGTQINVRMKESDFSQLCWIEEKYFLRKNEQPNHVYGKYNWHLTDDKTVSPSKIEEMTVDQNFQSKSLIL